MYPHRLLTWLAGVFVLGEICGIYELSGKARILAAMAFLLVLACLARGPGYKSRQKGKQKGSRGLKERPLLLLLSAAFFAAGLLLGAAACRGFQGAEEQDFFQRYGVRNEGVFDYGLYLKGMGIASEEDREAWKQQGPRAFGLSEAIHAEAVRTLLRETLEETLPEKDAGLFLALLVGDRSGLPDGIRELYQSQGIAHLLAISGLHLGIIGMGLYRALRKLGLGTGASGILAGILIVCYGILTGAQGSALRAVLMLLVHFLSLRLGRSYDLLSALSLSAIMLAAVHPYIILQSGFQLSFGAVCGIGLLSDGLIRGGERLRENAGRPMPDLRRISDRGRLHSLWKGLTVSLSIQLFTLPVVLYHFYCFPLYGILLNFIVIPMMGLVIGSGLLALGMGLLAKALGSYGPLLLAARGAAGLGHYILELYEGLCRFTEKLPYSSIVTGRPELPDCFFYYIVMIFLFFWLFGEAFLGKWRRGIFGRLTPGPGAGKRLGLFFLLLSSAAVLLFAMPGPERLQITAVDVGQGDGFLIRLGDCTLLLDCGSSSQKELGRYTLEPLLLSRGIRRIDAAFVSHSDLDHTSGLLYLLEEQERIPIHSLYLPKAALEDESYRSLKEAFKDPAGIHYLSEGDSFFLKGKLRLSCLYEGRAPYPEANSHSPFLLLEYGDFRMAFTGDMTKGDEELLAKRLRQKGELPGAVTVYKAAHHGSRTSSSDAVLKLFSPEYALISYGPGNSYGHPHREVRERFLRYGAKLLETGERGQIILETDGRRLWIKSFLPRIEPVFFPWPVL